MAYKSKKAATDAAKRAQGTARGLREEIEALKKEARQKVAAAKRTAASTMKRAAPVGGGGALGGAAVAGIKMLAGRYNTGGPGLGPQLASVFSSNLGAGAVVAALGGGAMFMADGKPKRAMLGDIGSGMLAAGLGASASSAVERFAPVQGFVQIPSQRVARYIPPPAPVEGLYQLEVEAPRVAPPARPANASRQMTRW